MKKGSKFLSFIKKALPHLTFVFAAMLIVLLIINYYNPLMNFLDNGMAHALQWALAALTLILSAKCIYTESRK